MQNEIVMSGTGNAEVDLQDQDKTIHTETDDDAGVQMARTLPHHFALFIL